MNAKTYKKQQLIEDLHKQLKYVRNKIQSKEGNLPTIHKTKHYLFHSLNKSHKFKFTLSPTINNQQFSQQFKKDQSTQFKNCFKQKSPSICNLSLQQLEQKPPNRSGKLHLNSTWRRMVINSKISSYDHGSTRYIQSPKQQDKKNQNPKKSQTIDSYDKKINNDMFTPRMTKMDMSKKNSEVLQKYLNKFRTTKTQQQTKKFLNISHIRQLTDKSHFQQLQRLKLTIENRKLEQSEKKFSYLRNKINLYPQKKKIRKSKLNASKDEIRGQHMAQISFQPWQKQIQQQFQIQMH